MIHSLSGKVTVLGNGFLVIETGGLGFKVFCPKRALVGVKVEQMIKIFTHLRLKEDALQLYGFPSQEELFVFELLNLVNGVGPKSALTILGVLTPERILAAIKEGKVDVFSQASGVGRKLAERIILELKGKFEMTRAGEIVSGLESDQDLIEALVGLGYRRGEIKGALSKTDVKASLEERLKLTLKFLSDESKRNVSR